jgi:hypothetical protein
MKKLARGKISLKKEPSRIDFEYFIDWGSEALLQGF